MSVSRIVTVWCDGLDDATEHAPGCPQHDGDGDGAREARRASSFVHQPGGRDYSRECWAVRLLLPPADADEQGDAPEQERDPGPRLPGVGLPDDRPADDERAHGDAGAGDPPAAVLVHAHERTTRRSWQGRRRRVNEGRG